MVATTCVVSVSATLIAFFEQMVRGHTDRRAVATRRPLTRAARGDDVRMTWRARASRDELHER